MRRTREGRRAIAVVPIDGDLAATHRVARFVGDRAAEADATGERARAGAVQRSGPAGAAALHMLLPAAVRQRRSLLREGVHLQRKQVARDSRVDDAPVVEGKTDVRRARGSVAAGVLGLAQQHVLTGIAVPPPDRRVQTVLHAVDIACCVECHVRNAVEVRGALRLEVLDGVVLKCEGVAVRAGREVEDVVLVARVARVAGSGEDHQLVRELVHLDAAGIRDPGCVQVVRDGELDRERLSLVRPAPRNPPHVAGVGERRSGRRHRTGGFVVLLHLRRDRSEGAQIQSLVDVEPGVFRVAGDAQVRQCSRHPDRLRGSTAECANHTHVRGAGDSGRDRPDRRPLGEVHVVRPHGGADLGAVLVRRRVRLSRPCDLAVRHERGEQQEECHGRREWASQKCQR